MNLIPRDSLFDNMFGNVFSPTRYWGEANDNFFTPRVDVKETANQYVVSAELPGVEKKDLKVTLEKGLLTIEAESNYEDKEEKEGRLIRQERRYGRFMRSFELGADVKEKDIDASFKDGILTLTAPKLDTQVSTSKRIEIH